MSELVISLAQAVFIIWPFLILGALVYSFQGLFVTDRGQRRKRGRVQYLGRNMRTNLLVMWTFLFLVWLVTLFAERPNLSILPEPLDTGVFLGGYALMLLAQASRLGWFKKRVNAHLDFHRAADLRQLKDMDPYDFEALVGETYRMLGYKVKHVGQSGDHGVDLEMYAPSGEHWIVQCKRYRDSVGESIVRDMYGSMTSERADHAALVTTAEITPPARAWAQGKPITLVDGPAFLDLMIKAREASEGTFFDRLAHGIDHLVESLRGQPVPALTTQARSASQRAAQARAEQPRIAQTQPNHARQAHFTSRLEQTQPVAVQPIRVRVNSGNSSASSFSAGSAKPANGRAHTNEMATAGQQGRPICPACGGHMKPRPPRPGDRPGRLLYRCANYPNCRAVVERQH